MIMSYRKWFIITISLGLFFAALVVAANFTVDHHAVRLSLFSGSGEISQSVFPDGINQQMFNAELIFRNPQKYDSFLFGSSRTAVIPVKKLPGGRFYNMSYAAGSLEQHLAIIRAMLQKGVPIKNVIIGLDDFSFKPVAATEKYLIRMMHPDAGGPGRVQLFFMYFFRKPSIQELSLWKDRVVLNKMKGRFIIGPDGLNLGWREKDEIIQKLGNPIFDDTLRKYQPEIYNSRKVDEGFRDIAKLIALAQEKHFSLIFFINPLYEQKYISNAESLFFVKERLAALTDYYDFSGFNSVTTDPMNYYEESHYRFRVGYMIAARLFGLQSFPVPADFGLLVTRQNVERHLNHQRRDLKNILRPIT